MSLHELGHVREWDLRHHAHKGPDLEGFKGNRYEVLVEEGTEEEHGDGGHGPGIAEVDHGNVEMSDAPLVDGHVPGAPEDVNVVGVPPVVVKDVYKGQGRNQR